MGYQLRILPDSVTGTSSSTRAMEEEVLKKVDLYINMLKESSGKYDDQGVIECYKLISIIIIIFSIGEKKGTMHVANMVLYYSNCFRNQFAYYS